MRDIVRLKTQTQVDYEAAVWTWRADSGELSQSERAQLDSWLRQDARHRRAFDELRRTWNALEQLSGRPQDEKLAALARRGHHRAARRSWRWQATAAVLVIALGTTWWLSQWPALQLVSTAVGQERHMILADGSQVTLNTNTLLAVRLTPGRRDIYLRRGEAHFAVTHDSSRPFFVHAGATVIRDVGTQFEVRLRSDQDVDVLVNEGRVEVTGTEAAPGEAGPRGGATGAHAGWVRALSAGEQLRIAGPLLQVETVSPRQIDDELAWRNGALVFQGEPLAQAIAEVGRYTRERILVTGPEVGSLRISGRFRTDDVPGFFQALQEALPVRVIRAGPGVIYIAAR